MYIVQSIHTWERVQDEKKQERQKCLAGTRQTDGKNWGLVWRNRKKISQIIKDYFHLPFYLLIILWPHHTVFQARKWLKLGCNHSAIFMVFVFYPANFKFTLVVFFIY
jgi:hypothetical protein